MNAQDLTILADHLDTKVKAEDFDMRTWSSAKSLPNRLAALVGETCGTTACAMGEACAMPYFKAKGLKLLEIEQLRSGTLEPVYKGHYRGFRAAEELFGLSESQAVFLFSIATYRGPKLPTAQFVARRIRNLIESGGNIVEAMEMEHMQ